MRCRPKCPHRNGTCAISEWEPIIAAARKVPTMKSLPMKKKDSPPAPCRFAQWLLYGSTGFCLLVMVAIGTHLWLRSPGPESAVLAIKTFSLSETALWPAGSPKRSPETLHPGVDLRLIPVPEIEP